MIRWSLQDKGRDVTVESSYATTHATGRDRSRRALGRVPDRYASGGSTGAFGACRRANQSGRAGRTDRREAHTDSRAGGTPGERERPEGADRFPAGVIPADHTEGAGWTRVACHPPGPHPRFRASAGVAQLAERQPSKLKVAGSNPVARLSRSPRPAGAFAFSGTRRPRARRNGRPSAWACCRATPRRGSTVPARFS